MNKLFFVISKNPWVEQGSLVELITVFPTGSKGGGWFSTGEITYFLFWREVIFIGEI